MLIDKKAVGIRIKDIRQNSSKLIFHTMEELAEKVGSNKSNVSRWERGINLPSKDALSKIADLGNITVEMLLGKTAIPVIKGDLDLEILSYSKNRETKHYEFTISISKDSKSIEGVLVLKEIEALQTIIYLENDSEMMNILYTFDISFIDGGNLLDYFNEISIKKVLGVAISFGYKVIAEVFPDWGIQLDGGGIFRYKNIFNWDNKIILEYFTSENNEIYLINFEFTE